jgi:hypothetical protein
LNQPLPIICFLTGTKVKHFAKYFSKIKNNFSNGLQKPFDFRLITLETRLLNKSASIFFGVISVLAEIAQDYGTTPCGIV